VHLKYESRTKRHYEPAFFEYILYIRRTPIMSKSIMTEGAPSQVARELGNTSYLPSGGDMHASGGGTQTTPGLNPTIEDYENIFGPAARDIKLDSQRHRRHQRYHLPDVLRGPNPWLTDRVDGLIANGASSPFTTIILPYKYVENPDQKLKWNRWSFDEGMASRVPYESAARVLTQSKRSYSGYIVRQGLAISLEHNFMMSEAGRKNFENQMQQMVGCIQYTNDLDVHVALVQAPSYAKHVAEKYFSSGKTSQQVIREYIDLFGIVQKNPNAMSILIEEAKNTFASWGAKDPNFILLNQKLTFQLTMTPEKTSYITQGIDGLRRLRQGPNIPSYRGLSVIRSRAFAMETGAPPRDILRRRVRVAEYYRIPAKYAKDANEVELYDESRDAFFRVSIKTLRQKAIIDGDTGAGDVANRDERLGNCDDLSAFYEFAHKVADDPNDWGAGGYFRNTTEQSQIFISIPVNAGSPRSFLYQLIDEATLYEQFTFWTGRDGPVERLNGLARYCLQPYILCRLDADFRRTFPNGGDNPDDANVAAAVPILPISTYIPLSGRTFLHDVRCNSSGRGENIIGICRRAERYDPGLVTFCPNTYCPSQPHGNMDTQILQPDFSDNLDFVVSVCNVVFSQVAVGEETARGLMRYVDFASMTNPLKSALDKYGVLFASSSTMKLRNHETCPFLDKYNPFGSVLFLATIKDIIPDAVGSEACETLLRNDLGMSRFLDSAPRILREFIFGCINGNNSEDNLYDIGAILDNILRGCLAGSNNVNEMHYLGWVRRNGECAENINDSLTGEANARSVFHRPLSALLHNAETYSHRMYMTGGMSPEAFEPVIFRVFLQVMYKRFFYTNNKRIIDVFSTNSVKESFSGDLNSGDVVIIRPNIEHNMLTAILGRGGMDDLGATLWGGTELACFDDSQHGIWGMSYKYSQRAVIWEEKSLQRLYDISYDSYNGGKDSTFVDWRSDMNDSIFVQATNDTSRPYEGPSMMVMSFPKAANALDCSDNWPNPIVFHDNLHGGDRVKYPIDPDNQHSVANVDKDMRVFLHEAYRQRYMHYYNKMPDFSGLHICRKACGDASVGNESSCTALAFEGTMRVYDNNVMVYKQHGSGHHGVDYVGAASVRAGKGFMPSYENAHVNRVV
jgi:hypothetical protein